MSELPAELAAAIRAAPDDRAGYAVAADWLSGHGAPHGELIALALAGRTRDDARFDELQLAFEPAADPHVRVTWRWGFAWRLHAHAGSARGLCELLRRPIARFVRELVLDGDVTTAHLDALRGEGTGALANLSTLVLRCAHPLQLTPAELGALATALPALAQLDAPRVPADARAPRLRELIARGWERADTSALASLRAPALTELALAAPHPDELGYALSRRVASGLRRLTILAAHADPALRWQETHVAREVALLDVVTPSSRSRAGTRHLAIDHIGTAGPAALVQLSPPIADARHPFGNRDRFAIGRADESHLRLAGAGVGRQHVWLGRNLTGEWRLHDGQSTDGTRVNQQPLDGCGLRDGDVIEIGDIALRFEQGRGP